MTVLVTTHLIGDISFISSYITFPFTGTHLWKERSKLNVPSPSLAPDKIISGAIYKMTIKISPEMAHLLCEIRDIHGQK